MHGCIDITYDMWISPKNFSPFLEIGQNGANKEFILIYLSLNVYTVYKIKNLKYFKNNKIKIYIYFIQKEIN
jgi:hypothetical protein